jgi:hypothetical protein
VYVYDGDLDRTGHARGCESDAWRHQLVHVDRLAEQLHDQLPPGAVLLVTADHGMVDVAPDRRIDVVDVPELTDGVEMLAGEARLRHLYTRPGAAAEVAAAWAEALGDRGVVRRREDAVAEGWFGPVEARVLPRLGDVIACVTGDCAVLSSTAFPQETRIVGLHGALTDDELLVPLLIDAG